MIKLRNIKFSSDGKYQYTCGIIHNSHRDDLIIFRDKNPTIEVLEGYLSFDGCCSIVKIAIDRPIDFDPLSLEYKDGVLSFGVICRSKPYYCIRLDDKSNYIPVLGLKVVSRGVSSFDR